MSRSAFVGYLVTFIVPPPSCLRLNVRWNLEHSSVQTRNYRLSSEPRPKAWHVYAPSDLVTRNEHLRGHPNRADQYLKASVFRIRISKLNHESTLKVALVPFRFEFLALSEQFVFNSTRN